MKQYSKIFCSVLVAVTVILAGNSIAYTQVLDDTWFELKVKAKGMAVDPDETVKKGKLSTKAYMYVIWNEAESAYQYAIISEYSKDKWDDFSYGEFTPTLSTSEEYIFLADYWMGIAEESGAFISFYCTAYFNVVLDKKTGELKKATFESLGAEIYGPDEEDPEYSSTLDGENDFYGGVTLKGKLIDESKLPFVVE